MPVASRVRPALTVLTLVLTAGCGAPGYERCVAEGGEWRTSARDPGGDGVCVAPAPDEGRPCRNRSECAAGICECPGIPYEAGPGRVEDGVEVTGSCSRFPARGGAGWICTVEEGVAHRQGIIVD